MIAREIDESPFPKNKITSINKKLARSILIVRKVTIRIRPIKKLVFT
jgi:hypothetical protein